MKNKVVVMGLSGGMDSSTLLASLLGKGHEVHACVFTYGSKHNKYENASALNIVKFFSDKGFKVTAHQFNLTPLMTQFTSALLLTGEDIPEGHYNDENMKKTVVPGRNLIFSSIMAGLAESLGAESIALGVHQGDHHIYPDCRPEFIKSMDTTIFLSTDRRVQVLTPFQDLTKEGILEIGYSIHPATPYSLTRTCYKDQELSCGKCGSCQERLEAFKLFGIIDPIKYE